MTLIGRAVAVCFLKGHQVVGLRRRNRRRSYGAAQRLLGAIACGSGDCFDGLRGNFRAQGAESALRWHKRLALLTLILATCRAALVLAFR